MTRKELWTEIKKVTSEIHGYEMAHHIASTRSEKIKWTKRLKEARARREELRKQLAALDED